MGLTPMKKTLVVAVLAAVVGFAIATPSALEWAAEKDLAAWEGEEAGIALAAFGEPAEAQHDRDGKGLYLSWKWAGKLDANDWRARKLGIGRGCFLALHATGTVIDYAVWNGDCARYGHAAALDHILRAAGKTK